MINNDESTIKTASCNENFEVELNLSKSDTSSYLSVYKNMTSETIKNKIDACDVS